MDYRSSAARSVTLSECARMGSPQQFVAGTALGCLLAFFMARPVLHALSCVQVHLLPLLLRSKELPPGSLGFLFLEETLYFMSSLRHGGGPARFVNERTEKFRSETFKTSIFLHPTVVVQGAAANRFLASGESKQELLNSWPASTLELLGRNVPVAVHGAQHKRQRQIMSACLAPAALQKVMGKADRMTRQHFEETWKEGAQLSIVSSLKTHVFRIACSMLAGTELVEAVLSRMEPHFRTWIAGMAELPLNVPGTAFNKARRARDALHSQIDEVIRRRRQQLQQHPSEPCDDLLSQMILAHDEDGSVLTPEELREVTLFLIFAGHDTSATTLMFALKFLEQNPSCLQRLVQEHECIVANKQPGEVLNWKDVTNMKYTWAVLQESMRLRPPVLGGIKEAQKELKYNGYTIPKGWKMFFSMSSTHENDDYFKEASKFDPSRFEVDRMQKEGPPPFSFVAFGVGPHACKGGDFARMNMSLYIHHLIMGKFTWTSLQLHEEYHSFPMLTFTKGYPVIVSRDNVSLI